MKTEYMAPTELISSSHFADDATQSSADEMSCSFDDQTGLDADKHRKHCGSSADVTGTVNGLKCWNTSLLPM